MNKRNEAFKTIFEKLGINVQRVMCAGAFVHVDTFEKYENKLIDAMAMAGFAPIDRSNGRHLDDYVGYRIIFKLK